MIRLTGRRPFEVNFIPGKTTGIPKPFEAQRTVTPGHQPAPDHPRKVINRTRAVESNPRIYSIGKNILKADAYFGKFTGTTFIRKFTTVCFPADYQRVPAKMPARDQPIRLEWRVCVA